MERRRCNRIPVILKAKVIIGDKTYAGFIENVSVEGIKYSITSFFQTTKDFTPEMIIKLNFQNPSGETLNLNCELIWFSKISPNDTELTLGMKIIDPPQNYKEFVRTLIAGTK